MAERNCPHLIRMTGERTQVCARMYVPQPYRSVVPSTCDGIAVWTEGNAIDPKCMPFERAHVFSCIDSPQPNGTVPTAAGDYIAIGTERNAINLIPMPFERVQVFSRTCVPQPDGLVQFPLAILLPSELNTRF